MNKEKSNNHWDLIAKYLAGEADKGEELLLREWTDNSEANRTYFAELEQWWRRVGQLSSYGAIDTEADWQQVKQRLKLHEPTRRMITPHRNFFERYSFPKAIAAVIAFIAIVGAAYSGIAILRERGQSHHTTAFNRINVPNGQMSQMILADGTSVWLNAGSSLQFPGTFDGDNRTVKLEGEAYFEVAENKKVPFVVQTLGLEVKVYGTSFNVRSYPNDATEEVILMSGSVSVKRLNHEGEIILKPDQKVSYSRSEGEFNGPVATDKLVASAWREGKLVFEDEPFSEIAKKLERRYGVTIHIEDESICQQRYRGAFRKETLEQAIKAIQFTAKYKYKIDEDVVTIYK